MKLQLSPKVLLILAITANAAAGSVSRLSEGRIVGGESTTIEAHPYQVSLVYYNSHRCGGAIISEYFVISAAHCFYEVTHVALTNFQIRAGSVYRTSGGTLYALSYYVFHDSFTLTRFDYDVALIKVKTPFEFGSTIQPIELPSADYDLPDGTIVGVSGWGRLEYTGTSPNVLQVVQVPLMNNTYCGELYDDYNPVTDRMICAGYDVGGKDACQGDSGGPLFYDNTLIGIVSWGDECAVALRPGVYARVSSLRDWVLEKTGLDFF